MALRRLKIHPWAAWLAMLAMALVVVMPAISRVVMPVSDAMHSMPGMVEPGVHQAMHHGHATPPMDHGHGVDHCGYCVLFDLQSALASGHVLYLVPAAPTARPMLWTQAPSHGAATPLGAQPRGPPAIV